MKKQEISNTQHGVILEESASSLTQGPRGYYYESNGLPRTEF